MMRAPTGLALGVVVVLALLAVVAASRAASPPPQAEKFYPAALGSCNYPRTPYSKVFTRPGLPPRCSSTCRRAPSGAPVCVEWCR